VIDRRTFLAGTGAVLLAAPLAAQAQSERKVYRIAYVSPGSRAETRVFDALKQGLRERQLIEGRNLVIEQRYAEGKGVERLRALMAEVVAMKVDLIVTVTTAAALEAKNATQRIPIIMAVATDPVGAGVVDSLPRPGGNISGMTLTGPELTPKRLELLKIVAPDVQRVVVVVPIDIPVYRLYLQQAEAAASALAIPHVGFEVIGVSASGKWEEAFVRLGHSPHTALLITESPIFLSEGKRLAALALAHRLPAVYGLSSHVQDGGLMSYGADLADVYYRAARLVGKILLDGATPADLPVEQPKKFELVMNLKTAKSLGLTIPQSLLMRADKVIQ
jgi:putative tryptophan/tyrosine transport system substrate-binding protein